MAKSYWASDLSATNKLSAFMAEKIYPTLKSMNVIEDFKSFKYETILDRTKQNAGEDVDFIMPGQQIYRVDEKTAMYYMNTPLATFSFELGYVKNNDFHPGWFVSPQKRTTHYLLLWVTADPNKYSIPRGVVGKEFKEMRNKQLQEFEPQDISKLDILMVSRHSLQGYLRACGLDTVEMTNFAKSEIGKHLYDTDWKQIKITPEEYLAMAGKKKPGWSYRKLNAAMNFRINRSMNERPCNLLINRSFLEENMTVLKMRLTKSNHETWHLRLFQRDTKERLFPTFTY